MPASPPSGGATRMVTTTMKFASVAGLGLLTGTTVSQYFMLPPSLLSLPQPSSASSALSSLKLSFLHIHRTLARSTIALSLLAFFLSPSRARHPYLLWVAIVTGLTARYAAPEVHFFLLPESKYLSFLRVDPDREPKGKTIVRSSGRQGSRSPDGWEEMRASEATLGSGAGDKVEGDVNGERVRERIDRWGAAMRKLAVGYGVAFTMGLVGVWGDRFGV